MSFSRIRGEYKGRYSEQNWYRISIDGISGGVIAARIHETLVCEGRVYRVNLLYEVDRNDFMNVVISTSHDWTKIWFYFKCSKDGIIRTHEGPTITDFGQECGRCRNTNHNIPYESGVTVYPFPIIADPGQTISEFWMDMERPQEAILKPNINYLGSIESKKVNNMVNVMLMWHDIEPKLDIT